MPEPFILSKIIYLIAFAESWATPEVCFSLHSSGAQVVCLTRHGTKGNFARLNFVHYLPICAPEHDLHRAVGDIELIIAQLRPEAIIACEDAALLVMARLKPYERQRLIPAIESCTFAIDKWSQLEAAGASGFAVPQTQIVRQEADVAHFLPRPAILKPRNALDIFNGGVTKGRAFLITDDKLPTEARIELSKREYLIQEYKVGIGEGVFGIAHLGGVYATFGHRRVRMVNPAGSGSSACVSRELNDEELFLAKTLIRRFAWQGPFMVELLRDASGLAWFMEFNGRFWGSLALARRCGLDMPRLACAFARGDAPEIPSEIAPGFARHLGRDLIHLMLVLRGSRDHKSTRTWPGRMSTLKAVLSPNRLLSFYNYHPSQPAFFLKDAITTVTNAIMRRKI